MEHHGDLKIKPNANTTDAFVVEKADGTDILKVDSSTPALTLTGAVTITGAVTLTGALTQTGNLSVTGDFSYSGHKDSQIMLFNAFNINGNWTNGADGTCRLAASETAQIFCIPLTGLKVGDEIVGFRILGQIESGGNTATLDADLRKVTKAAADVTDASVGAITQVSATEDTAVDSEKTFTATTIAADFGYYVKVTGTTAAATDIAVIGVEVDVNRK